LNPDLNEDTPRNEKEIEKSLARSLLMVFLRTAAADGAMTKEELAAFFQIVKKPIPDSGELFNRARNVLLENRHAFLNELEYVKVDFVGNMTAIRQLVEAEFPEESDNFKLSLYRLAKAVAESSVDFFGFGAKVNKSEKKALQTIATVLGVPPV
jgi:tellurite resistance protein